MLREELIDQFYNEFGYVPDEQELEDYQADYGYEEYHSRPNFKSIKHTQSSFEFEPSDDLLVELNETFKFLKVRAKQNIKERQENLLQEDNLDEFVYMLSSFLLKAGLYFILKKSFEKGYKYNELN